MLGPTWFFGGLTPTRLRNTPREVSLQEKTGGQIWDDPGVIFRPQDRLMGRARRVAMLPEFERACARRRRLRAECWLHSDSAPTEQQMQEAILSWKKR